MSMAAPVLPSLDVRVTGRRVVATWIDVFLIGGLYRALATPMHLPLSVLQQGSDTDDFAARVDQSIPSLMSYLALAGLYYLALETIWGRTVGKLVTGIRVVSDTGQRPTFGQVLLRTVFRLLDGMLGYLVGFLLVVFSRRRQRLGDVVGHTIVVRRHRS